MFRALLLTLFFSHQLSAQTDGFFGFPNIDSIITSDKPISCRRTWMSEETAMDSIKRSLSAFQTAIDSLDADTLVPTNNLYKLQFDVFHELRQEAWGDLNEQYCVSGTLDTLFQLNHFLERSPGAKVEVFGSHIVMTWTHYYLGNCQKWTTSRYYLIRED